MNVLGLVQLCAAQPPLGGYAHSLGFDQAAAGHQLTSAADLDCRLRAALHAAIAPADGIASGIAFRSARCGQLGELPAACAALSSDRVPPEMRLASIQMGQHLWALSRQWDWARAIHDQLDGFAQRHDLHHAIAFGTLVSETTSHQVRAIAAYLLNVARGIIDTAVRLIPLPESEGQRVLSNVQPEIAQLAAQFADKHATEIAVCNT